MQKNGETYDKSPAADNIRASFAEDGSDRASTSGEKSLDEPAPSVVEDDYGCEHYKRKSKFVVCR